MANTQIGDTEKAPFTLVEMDAKSFPTQGLPTDVISVVSSDPTVLSIVLDAIPVAGTVASGFVVGAEASGGERGPKGDHASLPVGPVTGLHSRALH